MDRVLRNTPSVTSATFSLDGVPTAPTPNTATVEVLRENGTVLVAAGAAATSGGTAGRFEYTLTTAQTALLDVLTIRWTTGNLGTIETTVEVVGGFLFSLADARRDKDLTNTTKYPAAELIRVRTLAETALEEACGVAFVPRYGRDVVDGNGGSSLLLDQPRVSAIRAVSVDGTALSAAEFDLRGVWGRGYSNAEITYEHGYRTPPLRVSQACLLLAKQWAIQGPIDTRSTARVSADGGFEYLATPGRQGATFGIPEVDAVVMEYGLRVSLA